MENSNIINENSQNLDSEKSSFFEQKVSSSNGKEDVPKRRFKNFKTKWLQSKIGEILKIKHGKDYKDQLAQKKIYPVFGTGGVITHIDSYLCNWACACIGRKGTINRPQFMDTPFWAVDTLFFSKPEFNQNPKFQYYLFNTINWLTYNEASGLPSLSASTIENIKINIPSVQEQEKIAEFLSLVDKRIEKQRQLVENLKKYKRGLLNAIFEQKIRFKDKDGNDFPQWKKHKIKEIFTITRGYVLSVNKLKIEKDEIYKYPVFSSQTKNNGLMGYYDKPLYKNSITWTTDGANAGFVQYREGEFYCTNVCGVLLDEKGNANSYIAERLNSVTKKHVSYVGNPKLMNNVMADIEIDFPSIEEQKKLASLITIIDSSISFAELELKSLNIYKHGLLQQMFI